jgi:CBS-domain-containing membrane protein
MRHHTVAEVMTTDVVTVTVTEPFKNLATLFVRRNISALPVLGPQGELSGIICESDLLPKEELRQVPGAGRREWHSHAMRAKAAADNASELMTTRVVTTRPEAPIGEAARLMGRHHVKCLPVVDEAGMLRGIVSARDLLKVFARPDSEIRDEIIEEVIVGDLGTNPVLVTVDVTAGVATITGEIERKSMIPIVVPLVRAVDGVVDATADLAYAIDDTRLSATTGLATD